MILTKELVLPTLAFYPNGKFLVGRVFLGYVGMALFVVELLQFIEAFFPGRPVAVPHEVELL